MCVIREEILNLFWKLKIGLGGISLNQMSFFSYSNGQLFKPTADNAHHTKTHSILYILKCSHTCEPFLSHLSLANCMKMRFQIITLHYIDLYSSNCLVPSKVTYLLYCRSSLNTVFVPCLIVLRVTCFVPPNYSWETLKCLSRKNEDSQKTVMLEEKITCLLIGITLLRTSSELV